MTHSTEERDLPSQFLLAKSDSEPSPDAVSLENVSFAAIQSEFPDIRREADFFEKSMAHVTEASHFGVLMLQIDELADRLNPNELFIALMRQADRICRGSGGLWGLMDNFQVGLVLPETGAAACQKAVERIKTEFAKQTGQTLTAGLAVYPTISYDKSRILENAKKAVVHAEFFGPDSCVEFDAVSLNISGDQYYQKDDITGAMQEYNLALLLDPQNGNVHNSLGVCYGVKGDLDEALSSFQTAMRLDPKEIMPIYNAGYAHLLKKEYALALEHFHQAEKIDPEVYELAFQTGRAYLDTNAPQTAVKYLETATRLNPKSCITFRLLGDCYHLLDRLSDAVNAYKSALKLYSEDACTLSALGFIYEIQGQNADIALMFCRRGSQLEPDNGLFRHRLARIYFNRQQLADALEEFQKAQDLGYESTHYIEQTMKQLRAAQ